MEFNDNEPYKEMIDSLIMEIVKHKSVFSREYDDRPVYKDLRWQAILEGHFFDQMYKLSELATADQIGEYVIEFFNQYDTGRFDVEHDD